MECGHVVNQVLVMLRDVDMIATLYVFLTILNNLSKTGSKGSMEKCLPALGKESGRSRWEALRGREEALTRRASYRPRIKAS